MIPRLLRTLSHVCSLWLIFFFVFQCYPQVNSEFYSSLDNLKILGNMESELADIYKRNLSIQKEKIETAQRFIKDVKFQHELARKDIVNYIENPINAFALIKRTVIDWKEMFQLLQFPNLDINEESITGIKNEMELVDDNELQRVIRGLMHLQDTYKLSANDFANGGQYGSPLDWNDCFEIGAGLANDHEYEFAIDWLQLSLRKLVESQETSDVKSVFRIHIKEYLILAYQGIGKNELAIKHLEDMLLENNEAESYANLNHNLLLNYKNYSKYHDYKIIDNDVEYADDDADAGYERLCRGENRKRHHYQLYCKLDSRLHPFFILSPLQVERLLLQPPITLYHNLLNDEQISKLLKLTHETMLRSAVASGDKHINIEKLINQQIWIDSTESDITKMLHKYVSAIAGFEMSNSEKMQVLNYGVTGLYEPHWDYLKDGYGTFEIDSCSTTSMFHLSDVEEGGFSVFPDLDVYIKPIKGSMAMWYNFHKSLKKDKRTVHAVCPIFEGTKWIANIWTKTDSQEFRGSADLVEDSIY